MSLKKLIALFVLMMPIGVFASDIYLEGISVIGDKKTAYLSLEDKDEDKENSRFSVVEGDSIINSWVVERIAERSIFLRTLTDEVIELVLHSRVSTEPKVEPPVSTSNADVLKRISQAVAEGQTVIAPPAPEKIAEGVYRGKPHFIEDKDIPPDYYRKRTPFGDYLIKNAVEKE